MFYSQFILAKKGPLATIWIAAHLERKLRKNQITDTNIGESVDSILYPEVPIALRLSGHLLLGVVRIYSRKVNLLLNDCSEALVKIHQAFQSSAVDLPPGAVVAPFHSITLPESFDFDDLEAHLSRENGAVRVANRSEFEHHVTARDLITLQDQNDDRRSLFTLDERFEDAGNPYAVLDFSIEELAPQKPISSSARSYAENITLEDDVLPPMPMEDDMDFEGMNIDKDPRNANENEQQIETVVEEPPPFPETTVKVPDIEKLRAANEAGEQEHLMGLEEPSVSMDVDERLPSLKKSVDVQSARVLEETPLLREEPTPFAPEKPSPARSPVAFSEDHDILGSILGKRTPNLDVMPTPVSIKRSGKKRKHAFDAMVSLSSAEMKKQLKSTNDICRARQKAPSTEHEIWMSKRDNHIDQIFSEPSFPGLSDDLKSIYDGVISKKFVSPRKPHTVDQASTRRTPRAVGRLYPDRKEGVDDPRIVADPEPFAEAQNESVDVAGPSTKVDGSVNVAGPSTKVDDVDVTPGQRAEPLSPDFDSVLAMDDGAAVDIAREQDGGSTMEHPEETTARESENEAAANVDNQLDGLEGTKSQASGLAFLADSRDTDEPANEIAASRQTRKGSSTDSGWSSRSRAVALYLKEKFETMDAEKLSDKNQNRSLNLERLLTGRTRKEAARLFFETLVLGTQGYLQVEQASSYADIQLLATRRLLKAVF